MDNNKEKELNEFQLRNIRILTHLLAHDAIDDEIVEFLRKSELDYFSMEDKINLLEQKINVDEKTNLLKYKSDYLTNIIKTASRIYFGSKASSYKISLIRFDIDDFSQFNNKYGHETGDRVLIEIANIIRENSRPTDYVIRFGGEEFDVILPSTDRNGAQKYISHLYKKFRDTTITCGSDTIKITVSAGISGFEYIFDDAKRIQDSEIEGIFKKLQGEADNALYESKYHGKDRFSFYSKDKETDYPRIR